MSPVIPQPDEHDEPPPEVDPHTGHPIPGHTTVDELQQGVNFEQDEPTPEEVHVDQHPTPDHPTGRLSP